MDPGLHRLDVQPDDVADLTVLQALIEAQVADLALQRRQAGDDAVDTLQQLVLQESLLGIGRLSAADEVGIALAELALPFLLALD